MRRQVETLPRVKPFLKWAGGKRRLLRSILPRIVVEEGTYFEPFLGAGAVLLNLDSRVHRVGSDTNSELVNLWQCVQNQPRDLLDALRRLTNTRDEYFRVRAWDRTPEWPDGFTPIERAARTVFLNKTCFNGLYRVNARGQFNVPYGDQKNALIADESTLLDASASLNQLSERGTRPEILHADYRDVVRFASRDDFVYFDPPYIPASKTASFVNYSGQGFTFDDQVELRDTALALIAKGVNVLISNSDTPESRELYGDHRAFSVSSVSVTRAVGAAKSTRKAISELLVMGGPYAGDGGL